jgi:hypothetical protein
VPVACGRSQEYKDSINLNECGPLALEEDVTRWLVYNGTIVLDVFRSTTVMFEVMTWFIAVVDSVLSLGLMYRKSSKVSVAGLMLATGGILVGYLGSFAVSPLWPRIIFCQTNGDGVFAFDLSLLFALPIVLGVTALLAAISGNVICPACQLPGIPLRDVWWRPVRRPCECRACAALSVLRHPIAFGVLTTIWLAGVLWLGYGAAGRAGLLLILPPSLVSATWLQHWAIRKFQLLTAVGTSCRDNISAP